MLTPPDAFNVHPLMYSVSPKMWTTAGNTGDTKIMEDKSPWVVWRI